MSLKEDETCLIVPVVGREDHRQWGISAEIMTCDQVTYFMPDAWKSIAHAPDVAAVPACGGPLVYLVPRVFPAAAWGKPGDLSCLACGGPLVYLVPRVFPAAAWGKPGDLSCLVGHQLEGTEDGEPPVAKANLETKWIQVGRRWDEPSESKLPIADLTSRMAFVDFSDNNAALVITWLLDWVEERRAEQERMNEGALTIAGVTAFQARCRSDTSGYLSFYARMALHTFAPLKE